jgi:hypothetical protein
MSMPPQPSPLAVPDAAALRLDMLSQFAAAAVGAGGDPAGVFQSSLQDYVKSAELAGVMAREPSQG